MRSSWIGFVSRRWFVSRRESGGAASSVLAASGIAIGVAALIVVLGVMNGFQMGFIDSLLEIASFHVRIENVQGFDEALAGRLAKENGVRSVLPFAETRCLISTPDGRARPIALRLLPPDADGRDPALLPALSLSAPLFPQGVTEITAAEARKTAPGIVLGTELARYLGLSVGDEVELFSATAGNEGVEARTLRVRIARVFRSGYYDFDFGLAIAPLSFAPLVFGEGAPIPYVYGIKLADRYADGAFVARLASSYGLDSSSVQSWRDYNRAFFGALRTEKTVMMLLIGLIFLVVGVNIFHSMRRAVAERMEDIAVLRAMGSSPDALRRAFILDGLAVGAGGAIVGLVLGLLVAVNVNEVFSLVEAIVNGLQSLIAHISGTAGREGAFRVFSPQYFYLMEVPVHVLFPETLFVVAVAASSAAGAAGAAASRVSRLRPAEVLRYE